MKRYIIPALCALLVLLALTACGSKSKLHIRVFIPESETGRSGLVYEGDVPFSGEQITVDALLNKLQEEGKFTYSYDGVFITIEDLTVYENVREQYIRGWTVTINGEYCEKGVFERASAGDNVELVYEIMDASFDGE